MKNLLTTLTLTIAALLCVSLTPTMVMAQAAAPASAAKKPAPPKPPVKPVAKAPAAKAVAAQPAWPAQLASCKTEAGMNPIKREMCVWKFCKGNWGQGGCPEESKPCTSQPSN